jgi:hypothetical protein
MQGASRSTADLRSRGLSPAEDRAVGVVVGWVAGVRRLAREEKEKRRRRKGEEKEKKRRAIG